MTAENPMSIDHFKNTAELALDEVNPVAVPLGEPHALTRTHSVERADGVKIGFTQIAGLVARRIVTFVKPGDMVASGERVGLIRFGSRVDVYLPEGTEPRVTQGQRTIAGETIIADIGNASELIGIPH